jgi:hypothetical protein
VCCRAAPRQRPAKALLEARSAGWPLVLHVDDERELSVALDVVARLIETNTPMMAPRRHRVVLSHPMPLDTARLATLGLTVAMPLPATWTGVAVDHTAAPAPSAPDASASAASASAASAPATATPAVADPAILPFSFPLPERPPGDGAATSSPTRGWDCRPSSVGAGPHDTASATPAADAAGPEPAAGPSLRRMTRRRSIAISSSARSGHVADVRGRARRAPTRSGARSRPDGWPISSCSPRTLFELPASHPLDAVVIATVVDGKVVYATPTRLLRRPERAHLHATATARRASGLT